MQQWLHKLHKSLEKLKSEQQLRTLKIYENTDFISNDYLGIVQNDVLQDFMVEPLMNNIQLGSTGSRLLTGNSVVYEEIEAYFAEYFACADALIANSGYDANLAILSALPSRNDIILYDEKVHASIKDGMRLSLASKYSVKHNDWNDLEKKIQKHRNNHAQANIFYVFETVYSMDGDIPELKSLIALAQKYDLILIADEAHAFGVFGNKGEGILQSQNLHKHVAVRMFGFGKAAGTYGAVIAVQDFTIKSYLLNTARSIIYTTALSDFQVATMRLSTDLIECNPIWRKNLHENIKLFESLLSDIPVQSPIIPVVTGSNEALFELFKKVQDAGFDVGMIRSPTVPKGQERLRIIVHAFNTEEDIRALVEILKNSIK